MAVDGVLAHMKNNIIYSTLKWIKSELRLHFLVLFFILHLLKNFANKKATTW